MKRKTKSDIIGLTTGDKGELVPIVEEKKNLTLGDLDIGDIFYPHSKIGKATPYFKVIGKKEFNPRHGSATRMCFDLDKRIQVSKSCRLEVIKKKLNVL